MDLDKFVIDSGRWIRLVLFILGPLRRALLNVLFENGLPEDPSDLYNYFKDREQVLKENQFIKHYHMEILLPTGKTQTDSGLFDIGLISTLIQDFSHVPGSKMNPTTPSFNWKNKKPTRTGLAASCVKARELRNKILGHYPDPTQLSSEDFEDLWTKLKEVLLGLGSTENVSGLKTQSLDPKQRMVLQSLILYLQTQQEGFKDRLDEFESTQTTTNQNVEQSLRALEKLEIKVSQVDATSEEYLALFREVEKQVLDRLTVVEARVGQVEGRVDNMDDRVSNVEERMKIVELNSGDPTRQYGLTQDLQGTVPLNDQVPVLQQSNIDNKWTVQHLSYADLRKLSDLLKTRGTLYNWEIFLHALQTSTNPDIKLPGVDDIIFGMNSFYLEVGRGIFTKLSVSKPNCTLANYINEVQLNRQDIALVIEKNSISNVSFNDILNKPEYNNFLCELIKKITLNTGEQNWKVTAEVLLKPCGGDTESIINLIKHNAEAKTKDEEILQTLVSILRVRKPKLKLQDIHGVLVRIDLGSVASKLEEIVASKS